MIVHDSASSMHAGFDREKLSSLRLFSECPVLFTHQVAKSHRACLALRTITMIQSPFVLGHTSVMNAQLATYNSTGGGRLRFTSN